MLENYQNGKFDISLNLALSILKKNPKHNLTIKILGSIYELRDHCCLMLKIFGTSSMTHQACPVAHKLILKF